MLAGPRRLRSRPIESRLGDMLGVPLLVATWLAAMPGREDPPAAQGSALAEALAYAQDALSRGKPAEGLAHVDRALERDAKSIEAWDLRARCEEALGDKDLQVHALHQELRLAVGRKLPAAQIDALRTRVLAVDPTARDLFDLARNFVPRLRSVAEQYVKDGRPHSAIRAYKEVLALAPDSKEIQDAIQAVAS